MTCIDDQGKAKGLWVRDDISHTVVNSLYANSKPAIAKVVSAKTKYGKKRNMSGLKHPMVMREI